MAQATATTAETKAWGGGRSPFNVSYGKMMMWFFLLSDAFTFGAFLISYGTTRFFSSVWPDANQVFKSFPFMGEANLPLLFVSLMTFILIMSSVTMVLAVHAGHYGDKKNVVKWLLWTIVGGICFLACQAWEWTHLHSEGGWWGSFLADNTPVSAFEHFFDVKRDGLSLVTASGQRSTHDFFNYFFTITGFHGCHVLSGVCFNIMILVNTVNGTYQ